MKVSRCTNNGEPVWKLDFRTSAGKRVRRFFPTKAEAESELRSLTNQIEHAGQVWLSLSADERNQLIQVWGEAKELNTNLRAVFEEWKRDRRLKAKPIKRITVAEAVQLTIRAKLAEECRPRYIESLEKYLRSFAANREGVFLDDIGVEDIESWFAEKAGHAPSTRKANMGRLAAMFAACKQRDYIYTNPFDRLSRPKVSTKAPVLLPLNQVWRMLHWTAIHEPALVPYIVIATFVGIRPEEIERLDWSEIDLQRGRIRVTEAVAKDRRARFIELEPVAIAWLKRCESRAGLVAPKSLRRRKRRVRDRAMITKLGQDTLRKTSASYQLALLQDSGKVVYRLGNSVRILDKHYRNIVSPEECAEFWSLTPERVLVNLDRVKG